MWKLFKEVGWGQDIPRPFALPPLDFVLAHIIAIAVTASHTSYQLASVGGPSMSMVNWLFLSAIEIKKCRRSSVALFLNQGGPTSLVCLLTSFQYKRQMLVNMRFSSVAKHAKLLRRSHV